MEETSHEREEVLKLRTQICKAMSNQTRLMIIDELKPGPRTTSELATITGIPAASLSPQLTILREAGLVAAERDGKLVYYRIADERLVQACDLLYAVLLDRLKAMGRLSHLVEQEREQVEAN